MAKTNASKSLGRGDLLAIAIGNVIGGGVMTMTGLAIGITGRSIVLSYIICAVMVTIVALPQFFLSGTIRMNGGFYTQAAMFGGKWFAGLYSVVFVSYFFGATMYSGDQRQAGGFRNSDRIRGFKSLRNPGGSKSTVCAGYYSGHCAASVYRVWNYPSGTGVF